MADKDTRWFKYLADALKEKYRNPQLVYYQGHHFEPTIYKWIRQTFATLHQRYGINFEDYMDIEERPVLEKLVRNLQTDPRLSFLNEPTKETGRVELPDEFHQQIEQEQIAQQQAAPGEAPAPQAGAPSGQAPSPPALPRLTMPQMPAFPTLEQPQAGEIPEGGQKPSEKGQTPPKGRGFNFPRMPNFAKNAGSNAGIFFKKGASRAATATSKGIGAAIGKGGNTMLGLGNLGINMGLNFSNEFSRLRVGTIGKKWIIGILLFLFIGAILIGLIQTQTPAPSPSLSPGPIAAGDISQCIFYRGGDPVPGLKYQNPAIPGLISDISGKVGLPPAVVAGIMRVETSSAFSDSPTSGYLTNDYDAHFSIDSAGNPVAYGIMQFTPNTFLGVFTRDQGELQTLFGKTDVTTKIDPQDAMAPSNIFRIYSIKDSITGAAFKARDDKRTINGDGPWDQTTVYEIARRYYGALEYTGFDGSTQNYGADLWKSYSNCTATGPILANASCPIDQGHITCGSYGLPQPWSGGDAFTGICTQDSTGNAGHCNDNYIAATGLCQPRVNSDGVLVYTAKSIDVVGSGTKAGSPIFLPTISGQSLKWYYKGAVPADNCSGCKYGFIRSFQSEPTAQGIWTIDFTHVNASDPFSDIDHQVQSGEVGATHYALPAPMGVHVHITLGAQLISNFAIFDPNWKFADRDLTMCI